MTLRMEQGGRRALSGGFLQGLKAEVYQQLLPLPPLHVLVQAERSHPSRLSLSPGPTVVSNQVDFQMPASSSQACCRGWERDREGGSALQG